MTQTISAAATAVPRPQPRPGDRWQFATRLVGGDAPLVFDHQVRELLPDGGSVVGVCGASELVYELQALRLA